MVELSPLLIILLKLDIVVYKLHNVVRSRKIGAQFLFGLVNYISLYSSFFLATKNIGERGRERERVLSEALRGLKELLENLEA